LKNFENIRDPRKKYLFWRGMNLKKPIFVMGRGFRRVNHNNLVTSIIVTLQSTQFEL